MNKKGDLRRTKQGGKGSFKSMKDSEGARCGVFEDPVSENSACLNLLEIQTWGDFWAFLLNYRPMRHLPIFYFNKIIEKIQ